MTEDVTEAAAVGVARAAVRPRLRRDRSAPARADAPGPHARPAADRATRLTARTGYLAATPEELRLHVGARVTAWPLRSPARPVVRALLLHGPVVGSWRVERGRGRLRTDPATHDAHGGFRGDRANWRPPVLLLLDAADAVVHFVPLRAWHPWGPVHGASTGGGVRPAGRERSRTAALAALRRTGWTDLLAAAGLPWTDAWSAAEPDAARVAAASAGSTATAVVPGREDPTRYGLGLLALVLALAMLGLELLALPRRGTGAHPHDPGVDAVLVTGWLLLVAVAALSRATVLLQDRRARRALPARTVLGARGGVRLLLGARPGAPVELGIAEAGVEAWFPATGPGAPATVSAVRCPGWDRRSPHHERRAPRRAEVRFAAADGSLLSVVPVHALRGLAQEPPGAAGEVGDDVLVPLEQLARRLGCRFEVLEWPAPLRVSGPGEERGYGPRGHDLLAALAQGVTVLWAARLALVGVASWAVLPVGAAALVAVLLGSWSPRRDDVRGVPVLAVFP